MRSAEWKKMGAVLLLVAAAVGEIPVSDWRGEEVTWYDARALARCGAAGIDIGPAAVFSNPAGLAFLRRPVVQVSYGMRLAAEQRTRVVYDQFENSLGELAYADNVYSNGIPGPMAAAYPRGIFSAGAALGAMRDFNYTYLRAYRDDFYVKVGEDRVSQTGMLYMVGLGAAVRPLDWLATGLRGAYMFGSRRLESWHAMGADTAYLADEGRPTGVLLGAGLVTNLLSRLLVGVDLQSGYRLKNWRDSAGTLTLVPSVCEGRYPWSARLGVSYRVAGPLPGTVSAEARYSTWHDLDSNLSNVLAARAGVEHRMLTKVRLRYGFGVEPMPDDPAIQVASFGLGTGIDAGQFRIDLGLRLSRRVFGPTGFWPELSETDVRVYESRNHFAFTLSREF